MRSRPAVQRASLHGGPDACLEPSRLDWTSHSMRGVTDPLNIESFIKQWHRQGGTKKMQTRRGGAAGQARKWRVFRRVARTSSLPITAHHQRQGLSRHAFDYSLVPIFLSPFSLRPRGPTAIHSQLKAHALNSYYEGYGWYAHSLYKFQV